MKKKRFNREFKEEACQLVMRQGYTAAQAARDLGIDDHTLRGWLKQRGFRATEEHKPLGDSDDPMVLKAQIRELSARVRRLETEKEILKKATAFFAGQPT
jgi:transposase